MLRTRILSHGGRAAALLSTALFSAAGSPPWQAMPAAFERHQGEAGTTVRFVGRTSADRVEVYADGSIAHKTRDYGEVRTRWAGGAATPQCFESVPVASRLNYYRGDDPARWRSDVRLFQNVAFQNIYPGIDISHRIVVGQFESVIEARPGSDPNAIRMEFSDGWSASVNSAGDLELARNGLVLRHQRPTAYQVAHGDRIYVDVRFWADGNAAGLRVQEHDASASLVISPVVRFSSPVGGKYWDAAYAITSDGSGNVYIAGETGSSDFPGARTGRLANDVFVTKMKDGVIIYTTILASSGNDAGRAIAVDASGNAYIAGTSGGADFPATAGAAQTSFRGGTDAFLARLDPSGRLLASTFLGGGGPDTATAVALNNSGEVHVAGYTGSADFPVTAGAPQRVYAGGTHDAFLAKLNAAGSKLLYGTLLGGGKNDTAYGVAVDSAGNAVIAGATDSPDLPTSAAIQPAHRGNSDAFIASLNPAGTRWNFATYFGGSSSDLANAVAVGTTADIYVTGSSCSPDFPVSASPRQRLLRGEYDGFVTRLSSTGTLIYSTYIGGSGADSGTAIVADAAGQAWVGGYTASFDFPTVNALQASNKGGMDAVLMQLDATGSTLLFSTYWGGALDDRLLGVAFGPGGSFWATGLTGSADFPGVGSGLQASGGYNAFITEVDPHSPIVASIVSPAAGSTLPKAQVFSWTAAPGAQAYWLDVGSIVGHGDYFAASTTATSLNVTGLPCTGGDLHVQLWTRLGGVWQQPRRYRYTAPSGCTAVLASPPPGTEITTTAVSFNWSPIAGANAYWLDVGSIAGKGDYFAGSTGGTSLTASGLPCNGQTLHVQLWTHVNGGWQRPVPYTYTSAAACSAALITPSNGATLAGSAVTFAWSRVAPADLYWLDIGSAPGIGDYLAVATSFTGFTVTGFPCDNRILYAQLWTHVGSAWRGPERYTFRAWDACGQLATPVPGTALSNSVTTFAWNAGKGVTAYWLDVGTQIGHGNIFAGNVGTATSREVTGIPTKGTPIYVQLWSLIDGTWRLNRYTYAPLP